MSENTVLQSLAAVLDEVVERGGGRRYAVYPCGCAEPYVSILLRERYGIEPSFYIDNFKESSRTMTVEDFVAEETADVIVLMAAFDGGTYRSCLKSLSEQMDAHRDGINVIDCFPVDIGRFTPRQGLADAKGYLKSIGAFCSVSPGSSVVGSHVYANVSSSSIFSGGGSPAPPYDAVYAKMRPEDLFDFSQTVIGHDVWIGKNVTILNGVSIGNGAVIGANSVVNRDVPDYAIAVGAPARVVKNRFDARQAEALNRIKWWDWSDELIAERFYDFRDVDRFIEMYLPR